MVSSKEDTKEATNLMDVYATCFKTIIQEYKPDKDDNFIFMIAN